MPRSRAPRMESAVTQVELAMLLLHHLQSHGFERTARVYKRCGCETVGVGPAAGGELEALPWFAGLEGGRGMARCTLAPVPALACTSRLR